MKDWIRNRGLASRIAIQIGAVVILAFAITIGIVARMAGEMSESQAITNAQAVAKQYARHFNVQIEDAVAVSRTLALSFEVMHRQGRADRRQADATLRRLLEEHPKFIGVWACYEPNAFDGQDAKYANKAGTDATGRYLSYWNRGNGTITVEALKDYETEGGAGDYYLLAKRSRKEIIVSPFDYIIGTKHVLVSSAVTPIIINGKFVGATGVDLALDGMSEMVARIKPFEGGFVSLVSQDGKYAAHPDQNYLLKDVEDSEAIRRARELKSSDEAINFTHNSPYLKGEQTVCTIAPLSIGRTGESWYLLVDAPVRAIMAGANRIRNTCATIAFITVLILIAAGILIGRSIAKPVKKLSEAADRLAVGDIDVQLDTQMNDEIGELSRSMSAMVSNIRAQAEAAQRIAAGDLDIQIEMKSDADVLARSMTHVVNSLRDLIEEANMLSKAAVNGQLAIRGNADKFQGGYRDIIQGVNNTLDALIGPLKIAANYMERISRGEIPSKITDSYNGDFNTLKNDLNVCIDAIRAMTEDTERLGREASNGQFDTRADASRHQGEFRAIVQGINNTLDTVVDKVYWYEQLLDAIPFPISVTDLDMNWTFINRPVEKMLGVTRKDILGKQCNNWNANICKTENCGIARLRRNELQTHFEQQGMNFQVDSSYVHNAHGEKVGHIEVVQDVSRIAKSTDFQKRHVARLSEGLEKLANGDLTFDIQVDAADEYTQQEHANFAEIAQRLNRAKEAINKLIIDTNGLVNAAIEGQLQVRTDGSGHHGDYRRIVEGINGTLDAIVTPIREAAEVLDRIAEKDLTARVKGNYKGDLAKIKLALNKAIDNLDEGLSQVAIGAEQVASASVQISTGSQSLSQGASEQASSLEEISSSLQEMASMTHQNTANAQEARGMADGTRSASEKGMDSMSRLTEAMDRIKASSDETAKIVKTIDEIAFQTNLLALNAAVEAARAGDAGKGFAVVAEEVRNLAMRSAEAAKSTADLIEGAVRNAEDGVEINQEVLGNLREINEQADKVSEVMAEIAAASGQQSQGIDQVNSALEQMNQLTQQNAANAEESASAAEELSSQSEEMMSMVAGFQLTDASHLDRKASASAGRAKSAKAAFGLGAVEGAPSARAAHHADPAKLIPFDDDSSLSEF